MRKIFQSSKILGIISTLLVISTLLIISFIQFNWLVSSAESDINEIQRNFNFSFFRSVGYELNSKLFSDNGINNLVFNGDIEEFKQRVESLDMDYIENLTFITKDIGAYQYSDGVWQNNNFFKIDRNEIGLFMPDPFNPGYVQISFMTKGRNSAIVYIYFNLKAFYKDKIEPTFNAISGDYKINLLFTKPDNARVINDEVYSYSPIRSLLNIFSLKKDKWVIGVNFLMKIEDDPGSRYSNYTIKPLPQQNFLENNFYLDISNGQSSIIDHKEESLTRQWYLTTLLLVGLGISYLLILNHINKLKQMRLKEKEFVATVTHELRTPLAVIESAADNIEKGIISGDRLSKYGGLIKGQSKRLGSLIEGILLFSRLEGKSEVEPQLQIIEKNTVFEIINSVSDLIKSEYNVDVINNISIPQSFKSDKESLEMILSNLLINSAKHGYNRENPGAIRVTGYISVPDKIVFSIEDDGVGIPKKEQRHIFEPFVRGERSYKNQINGSGLGLYLILKKARLLGGDIKLYSPYERENGKMMKGCKFIVKLPYNEVGA